MPPSPPSSAPLELVAGDDAVGRLDAWLAARLDVSRSRAVQWIDDGRVTLNGAPVRKKDPVAPGDRLPVTVPAPEPSGVAAEAIPLHIVYQDADLAVIDKPAGLVVH